MADTGLWIRVIGPDIPVDQVQLELYNEESSSDQPLRTAVAPETPLETPRKFLEIAADDKNQLWVLVLTDPNIIDHIRLEAAGMRYGHRVAHAKLGNIRFVKDKIKDYRDPIELTQTGNDWQPAMPSSGEWYIGRAATNGDVGEYSSIAIDRSGHMHISHYDNFTESLKYTTNGTGNWQTLTLAKNLARGTVACTSLVIDSNGYVHISYHDQPNLRYVTNVSGGWRFRSITNGGKENAIAVDHAGHLHIAFTRENELFYSSDTSGQWMYHSVDGGHIGCLPGDVLGRHIAIAVDHSNHAHISYYDHYSKNLRFATNQSGSWHKSTLVSEGDVGTRWMPRVIFISAITEFFLITMDISAMSQMPAVNGMKLLWKPVSAKPIVGASESTRPSRWMPQITRILPMNAEIHAPEPASLIMRPIVGADGKR